MKSDALMLRSLGRSVLICALAAAAACAASAQNKNPISGDPIASDTGKIAGMALESGIHAYLGIPFAQPPVGALRWHEPVPVKPWAQLYDATTRKPGCAQASAAGGFANADQYSEDCLYLYVWTPPTAKAGAKLPVLVAPQVAVNSNWRVLTTVTVCVPS